MNIPEEILSWNLGGKAGTIRAQRNYETNTGYNQLCVTNNEFLTWGERDFGVNLIWTSNANLKKTHFRKADGSDGEVLTGETVAFGLGGNPSFLYYGHQTFGINLKWSETPKFEWQLFTASGNKGERIQPGQRVAFINLKVEPAPDFLIYFTRQTPGINLGWTTSPDWLADFLDTARREAVKVAVQYFRDAL
jgi:hypothetical protein